MVETFKNVFLMQGTVDRKMYAIVGFGLMLIKYGIEAFAVWKFAGIFYQPATFLSPSISLRDPVLNGLPEWMGWGWVLFSLPFMWVALNMSVRRAIDAGVSPWFGIAVVVPVFNFFVMFLLSVWPTRGAPGSKAKSEIVESEDYKKSGSGAKSAAIGIGIGIVLALLLTTTSVWIINSYGTALFLGMPIIVGTVAGYWFNRPISQGLISSATVGLAAVFFGGVSLLLFAVEGVVCLMMAAPIILPLGAIGGGFGYLIAAATHGGTTSFVGALLIVPLVGWIEPTNLETYEAVTSVEIAADPGKVWQTVIAFPEIKEPPGSYFEYGIAYPIKARIEGEGVGAIRHCEFSTGAFVEPITCWDPPHRLSFDVTEQPEPMVELTPYAHIHPPHLDNSFRSVRGEFRLIQLPNGNTRLEGSTWYQMELGPTVYWKRLTDKILHDIHSRVLNHIKQVAEADRVESPS